MIWLSSYPKSGNTWVRVFLDNLRSGSDQPVDINHISISRIASSRTLFDQYTGVNSSDLNDDEIERNRPQVYRLMASETTEDIVLKVHDAWKLTSNKETLFPQEITKAVVYIIRNPLDVAVSSAFHNSVSFEVSTKRLNSNQSLCEKKDRLYNQLRQNLQSWSKHVVSWVDKSGLPLLVVRYEDLVDDPVRNFSAIVNFLDWPFDMDRIVKAIDNCEIEKLRKQEMEKGFREKPIKAELFFRSAKPGNWAKYLSDELIRSICNSNKSVMDRFGYSAKNPCIL